MELIRFAHGSKLASLVDDSFIRRKCIVQHEVLNFQPAKLALLPI